MKVIEGIDRDGDGAHPRGGIRSGAGALAPMHHKGLGAKTRGLGSGQAGGYIGNDRCGMRGIQGRNTGHRIRGVNRTRYPGRQHPEANESRRNRRQYRPNQSRVTTI